MQFYSQSTICLFDFEFRGVWLHLQSIVVDSVHNHIHCLWERCPGSMEWKIYIRVSVVSQPGRYIEAGRGPEFLGCFCQGVAVENDARAKWRSVPPPYFTSWRSVYSTVHATFELCMNNHCSWNING
jgi:hypothetical protein